MKERLKDRFKNFVKNIKTKARNLVLHYRIKARILRLDVRGDGSMNFLITVVISVAIAAILIGVISAAIPDFWTSIQSRITELLGS